MTLTTGFLLVGLVGISMGIVGGLTVGSLTMNLMGTIGILRGAQIAATNAT
jgi:hypothetical protein